MESPKSIILSSLPTTLALVRSGIESWKKLELKKRREIRPPCLDVSLLTSGWKVGKRRHRSGGVQQWQAEQTSPCSRLGEQRPCRVWAERTITCTEGWTTRKKRGLSIYAEKSPVTTIIYSWYITKFLSMVIVLFTFRYLSILIVAKKWCPPLLAHGINSPGYNTEKRRRCLCWCWTLIFTVWWLTLCRFECYTRTTIAAFKISCLGEETLCCNGHIQLKSEACRHNKTANDVSRIFS